MHYVGTRNPRAQTNPLRSIPLIRSASILNRSTPPSRMIGELRNALWVVAGYEKLYAKARADLGRANTHNIAWRRRSQSDAMSALYRARAAMRANLRTIAKLEAALLALAVPADRWADAAASALRG